MNQALRHVAARTREVASPYRCSRLPTNTLRALRTPALNGKQIRLCAASYPIRTSNGHPAVSALRPFASVAVGSRSNAEPSFVATLGGIPIGSMDADAACQANTQIFSLVVGCAPDKVAQAELILSRLIDERLHGNEAASVSTNAINVVLAAIAELSHQSKNQGGTWSEKAASLLQRLKNASERVADTSLDRESYIHTIRAYSGSGNVLKAEEILLGMESHDSDGPIAAFRPDTSVYNAILEGWEISASKSSGRNGAERAENILRHMVKLCNEGHKHACPDGASFVIAIRAWRSVCRNGSREEAKDALQRTEALLHFCASQSNTDELPDTKVYNEIIQAWLSSRNRVEGAIARAESIAHHMMELSKKGNNNVCPDIGTFLSLIGVLENDDKKRDGMRRAEALLKGLEDLVRKGTFDADRKRRLYIDVLKVWKDSRNKTALRHAEQIFEELKVVTGLDVEACNLMLEVICKSSNDDKAVKAQALLKGMLEGKHGDIAPTATSFEMVLVACSTTHGDAANKKRALGIAVETFNLLRDSLTVRMTPGVYVNFLGCHRKLSKNGEQHEAIKHIFNLCCKDGLVDENVFNVTRGALGPDFFSKMMKKRPVLSFSLDKLPPDWVRNVVAAKRKSNRGLNGFEKRANLFGTRFILGLDNK